MSDTFQDLLGRTIDPNANPYWLFDKLAAEVVVTGREFWEPGYVEGFEADPIGWAQCLQRAAQAKAQNGVDAEIIREALTGSPVISREEKAEVIDAENRVPTIPEVCDLREKLGRKLEARDLTKGMCVAAEQWLAEFFDSGTQLDHAGIASFLVDMKTALDKWGRLTPGQAKGVLNVAVAQQNRRQEAAEGPQIPVVVLPDAQIEPMTEGMYGKDGAIYKVKRSQAGRLYAMLLVQTGENRWNFEYDKGAIHKLTVADRLSIEEAQEFGKRTGTCCVCSRTLTNPESIELGIGPICGGRL